MSKILEWLGMARHWLTRALLFLPRVLKIIDTVEEELKRKEETKK